MSGHLVPIDDPDDERLAAYRSIRERDLVGREGLFVAEGKVVLHTLLTRNRFALRSMLVRESRLDAAAEIISLAARRTPVYVASGAVMDAVSGFHVHRGILGIGERGQIPEAAELLAAMPRRSVVVVAVGISNHDNIGAIFRNAAAFGAGAVLIDTTSCDPFYRKAIRVSVGAVFKVPFAVVDDAVELSAQMSARGFECIALSPSGKVEIDEIEPEGRIALFLGTEGEGLPETLMQRMRTVRIAMTPGFDSLNVAAASAVALHRLRPGSTGGAQ